VRVYQYSGDTRYNLTLKAVPVFGTLRGLAPEPVSLPNGRLRCWLNLLPPASSRKATAETNPAIALRNLSLLTGSRSEQGFVSGTNLESCSCFRLDHRSHFALRLDGLSADADVQLFDAAGQEIGYSIAVSSNPETITRALEPASYFVRVYQYSGDT